MEIKSELIKINDDTYVRKFNNGARITFRACHPANGNKDLKVWVICAEKPKEPNEDNQK